jgi:hypothetical protein
VYDAISSHVDPEKYRLLRSVEESERDLLIRIAGGVQ